MPNKKSCHDAAKRLKVLTQEEALLNYVNQITVLYSKVLFMWAVFLTGVTGSSEGAVINSEAPTKSKLQEKVSE